MRDAPVVVCSEVPNNPGGSITNSAGAIAAGVIEANELITPLVWIEHWPEETTGRAEETLDIVVFSNYEVVERAPYLRETRTWIGDATWKPLGFSEDEIRRPTLNAVPYGFAKVLYGLLRPGRRIGPPWMVAKTNRRGQPGSISATNAPTCASSTHKAVRLWKRAGCAPPRSSKATVLLRAAAAASRHRGGHSPWVSRVLEECGHEVMVANPRKVRLIYTNKSVGPRDPQYKHDYANALYANKRYKDAIKVYEEINSLDPQYMWAYHDLAQLYRLTEDVNLYYSQWYYEQFIDMLEDEKVTSLDQNQGASASLPAPIRIRSFSTRTLT